jgi:hypothetical protein
MSTALNNHSTSTIPGTVAISDDEIRRFQSEYFAFQPIEGLTMRLTGGVQHLLQDPDLLLGQRKERIRITPQLVSPVEKVALQLF